MLTTYPKHLEKTQRTLRFAIAMLTVQPVTNWVLWLSLASIPLFVFAWRSAWRGNYGAALALLVLGGLLLRIGPSLDPFLHDWDERYHALVAKNMLSHPFKPMLYTDPVMPYDHANWTMQHIWLHKPPFTLWCIAVSLKLFGFNEVAVRVPSLLVSSLSIWVCFSLIVPLYGRRTAFVASFLLATHGMVIEFASGRSATDHVDTMFLFLISLSVLCYQWSLRDRRGLWLICCGISLGLGVLTKWLPALIVIPVQILLARSGQQRTWRYALTDSGAILLVAFVIAAPWSIYEHLMYPVEAAMEARDRQNHVTQVLQDQGGPFYYYFDHMRIVHGELIYLPFIWFFFKLKRAADNAGRWAVLLWWGIPYAFFTLVATKMAGYVMFTTIPVLAIAAVFWVVLEKNVRAWPRYRWAGNVLLIALLALPVRYCIERLKPLADLNKMAQKRAQIPQEANPTGKRTIYFGCPQPIETMFYTDCEAYEERVDPATVARIEQLGYHVVQLP